MANTVVKAFILVFIAIGLFILMEEYPIVLIVVGLILLCLFCWPLLLILFALKTITIVPLFQFIITFIGNPYVWLITAIIVGYIYYKIIDLLVISKIRKIKGTCGGCDYPNDCKHCMRSDCNRRSDINKKLPFGGFTGIIE